MVSLCRVIKVTWDIEIVEVIGADSSTVCGF